MTQPPVFKIPLSVLVVIHTLGAEVLVMQRADSHTWQSVTGSLDAWDEPPLQAAAREVWEETGLDAYAPEHVLSDCRLENVYEIYPHYRHRYAPGVVLNKERVFALRVPRVCEIRLSLAEHLSYQWLPRLQAADLVQSGSNAEAILSVVA